MADANKNGLGLKLAVAGIVVVALLLVVGFGGLKIKETRELRREEAVLAEAKRKVAERHQALLEQARAAAGNFDKIGDALSTFESAEALGPVVGDDAVVYARLLKNRADEKAGAGRLDEALSDLKKAALLSPDLEGLPRAFAEVERRQKEIADKIVFAFVELKQKEERTLPTLNVCATLDRCVAVWEEGRKASHGEEPDEAKRTAFRNGESYQFEKWHAAIAAKLKIPPTQVEAACAKEFEEIERQLAKIEGDRDEADLRKLFKKLAGGYVANLKTGDDGHYVVEVTVGSSWNRMPKKSREEEIKALTVRKVGSTRVPGRRTSKRFS